MANRKKAGHRNMLLKLLKTEEKFLIFFFFLQDIFKKEMMHQGRTFPTNNGFPFHLKLRKTDDGVKLSLIERKGFAT